MGKATRIVSLSLAGAALTCAAIGISGYAFLRSPAGSGYLLAKAKRSLESSGQFRLEYDEAKIDPFASLYFKNLKVVQSAHGQDKTEVWIRSAAVKFSLSLWARRLDLEELMIDHPSILVHLHGAAVASAAPTPSSAFDMKKWIENPPLQVTIQKMELKDMSLNLDYQDTGTSVKASVQSLQFGLKGRLLPKDLSIAGSFKLGEAGRMFLAKRDDLGSMELQALPSASGQWEAGVSQKSGKWIYEIKPTHFTAGLKDIAFKGVSKDLSGTRANLSEASLISELKLSAASEALFEVDRSSVDSLAMSSSLKAGSGHVEQTRPLSPPTRVNFGAQQIELESGLEKDIGVRLRSVSHDLNGETISFRPFDFIVNGDAQIARDLSSFKGKFESKLAGIPFLTAVFTEFKPSAVPSRPAGAANGISVQATVNPDPRLAQTFRSAASLKKLGSIGGKANYQGDWAGNGLAKVAVEQRSSAGAMLKFTPVELQLKLAHHADQRSAKGKLRGSEIRAGQLSARDIRWDFAGDASGGPLHLQSEVEATVSSFGRWNATSRFALEPKTSGAFQGGGTTTLTQLETSPALELKLGEPVVFTHKADLSLEKADFQVEATIPRLDIARVGVASDTRIQASLHTPDYHQFQDGSLSIRVEQGQVRLDRALMKHADPMAGLNLSLSASVRGMDQFVLEGLSADFNHSMIKLTAVATGNAKRQDVQTQGTLSLSVPQGFSLVEGDAVHGKLEIPWTLSLLHGQEVDLEGELKLDDLAWSKGEAGARDHLHATQASGSIPISEKLLWDGKRLKFARLITQNPFERVDYERLRPLITGADQVRLEQVGVDDKVYGPFVGVFSIKQNRVFIHQFDMSLGSTGRAYGEMYFDAYPANLQMGILSRFTAVDLAEVLPGKFLQRLPSGDQKVSARSGLVVDFNKATVDGRIDVTQIGRSQLLTLINVMDPGYVDDRMNKVRSALGIGYPTFVGMAFRDGYLDMGFDLVVLGVSQREDIRGVPVSTWVQSATAGYLKKSKEGLLK